MKLSQEQKQELNKIFQENDVCLAYLFGSAAKGEPGPMSDLDFAVLFSSKVPAKKYFKAELNIAGQIGSLFKINRVDVVNLATVNNPLLKHNAVFGGEAVFSTDQKIKFSVERKTLIEYEDTKRLRETAYSILRRQIKDGVFGTAKLYVSPK